MPLPEEVVAVELSCFWVLQRHREVDGDVVKFDQSRSIGLYIRLWL